jgi:hypothetical protein
MERNSTHTRDRSRAGGSVIPTAGASSAFGYRGRRRGACLERQLLHFSFLHAGERRPGR